MKLICSKCGRDLNEIWQDNMSYIDGVVLCEDCYYSDKKVEDDEALVNACFMRVAESIMEEYE